MSNAVQLAVAAGYEFVAMASPKNFGYVKEHDASAVFDYKNPSIVDGLVATFEGKDIAE